MHVLPTVQAAQAFLLMGRLEGTTGVLPIRLGVLGWLEMGERDGSWGTRSRSRDRREAGVTHRAQLGQRRSTHLVLC